MDRLICGDVGYGKTEVALRAAFKAAERRQAGDVPRADDDPRPAALRHVHRAPARLPVPDRGGCRGSARAAEVRAAIEGLRRRARSTSSIGTHRLLSRDVRPKDLGLLIVDEEQRFGVKQKELLRQLRLQRGRPVAVGHADPAHAPDVARRPARHLGDRDPARGPAPGADLRRRVRRGPREAGDRAGAARAAARRSSSTTASRRSTRPPSTCARSCRRRACSWRTARWTRASSRR